MPRASQTRKLLNVLLQNDLKVINKHFELQPRRNNDELINQIVSEIGGNLSNLIVDNGPFLLAKWNKISKEIGGKPRKSFNSIISEIESRLDPVFYDDDFDGDEPISDIRSDKKYIKILSKKLAINKDDLKSQLNKINGHTLLSKFVTEFRKNQNASSKLIPLTSSKLRLASTQIIAENIEPLNPKWLNEFISDSEEISIIAGYYSVDFLRQVINKCKSIRKVKLLFNGLGGQRLKAQKKELEELCDEFSKKNINVEIRLAFVSGIFHTKLFLIKQDGLCRALVGSANATNAAFDKHRNEEILVGIPNADNLERYFEKAWGEFKNLDEIDTTSRSLISFYRTGSLYFKPTATLKTTLNPFVKLLKELTNEEKKILGAIDLPHAEKESGIGAFDLKLALEKNIDNASKDYLHKINLDEEGEEDDQTDDQIKVIKTIAKIKPYSIETCYGYWVPSAFDNIWKNKIDAAGKYKEKYYITFRNELNNISDKELNKKYSEYLLAAKEKFESVASIKPKLKEFEALFDLNIFKKFIRGVKNHLADEPRLRRLTYPFIEGTIPEIWDDEKSYKNFSESFFEYIEQINLRTTSQPMVPKIILDTINSDVNFSANELSTQFEIYLAKNGWNDKDWGDISEEVELT